MRKLAAVIFLVGLAMGGTGAKADDTATIAAVSAAAEALDQAFERQDAKAIEGLTTNDHIAVTPYYAGPRSVAEQVASLPELKYAQTNLDQPTVKLLSADVAMRQFRADIKGTYKTRPIPSPVYVTMLMVKRDGQWQEAFYQVTALSPKHD